MKRYTYYFAVLFVLLASILSIVPIGTVHADAKSKAEYLKDACGDGKTIQSGSGSGNTQTPSEITKEYNACKKGFNAALETGAVKPTKKTTDPCYKTIYKVVNTESGACELGYVFAYANRDAINISPATTPKDPNAADPEALAACTPAVPGADNQADLLTACEDGYTGAAAGKTKTEVCGPKSGIYQTTCETGFDLRSASADPGKTSPTCESNGFPANLSWLLCPIFNGVAGMSDWLFKEVVSPLLHTTPLSTDPSDPSYQAWSNFRIYGNIFLVIALLVVVFGQSIGGGLIDAYTAKKILPRLIIATILINLSIYIVAALVDITNIVGGSLGAIITAPLKDAGAFQISPTGIQADLVFAGTAVVGFAAWFMGHVFAASEAGFFGNASLFIALFIIMPVLLGLLAAFITLILRMALILALVLVSPFAFALYCLPNTQQYFRKWWDLLIQTLLVYPIVIIFFAVSDVLSVTVMDTGHNNNLVVGPMTFVISFVLQFLPLLFIPYSFRLAGGVLGRAHELMSNYHKRGQEVVKGNANDPRSLRNLARTRMGSAFTAGRANKLAQLRNDTLGPVKGTGLRRTANSAIRRGKLARMGAVNWGYNDLDRKRQVLNEQFDKDIQGKVAAGADFLERAFFARQHTGPDANIPIVNEDGSAGTQTLQSGRWYSSYRDPNGKYKEHNAADVKKAHGMYDGNESQIQTLIKYETGKVPNDQDFYGVDSSGETIYDPGQLHKSAADGGIDRTRQPLGSFMGNLPRVMSDAGLKPNSATGAQIGSFFATQAQRKELKHTMLNPDGTWSQNTSAFVQDWAENFGSYAASTSKTSPINRLSSIHDELQAKPRSRWTPADARNQDDLVKIARGLDTRMRAGGGIGTVTDDGVPIPAGSGAPGRVNEAIQKFVEKVIPTPEGRPGGSGGR
ncbi:MAG: rane protein of unknown function [Candidatus Saccharibacteria bacterium]|nr:rane protein of unknown function [Candidatus Saccharibacteria bacterium]